MSFDFDKDVQPVREVAERAETRNESNLSANIWDELREHKTARINNPNQKTYVEFNTASLYGGPVIVDSEYSRTKAKLEEHSENLRNSYDERAEELRNAASRIIAGAKRLGDPPSKPKTGRG
jgi:hypothetical protein